MQAGRLKTAAIAGSMRRGSDEHEDARLAELLTESAKNQREQSVVLRVIEQSLQPVCSSIETSDRPEVITLKNIHHLCSRVSGTLRPGFGLIDAVEALHPTPAVAGYPRERALQVIANQEAQPRGWYAGPVGWIDREGDGEFVVALRSALFRGERVEAFAGCGIVDGSDPVEEWEETELKLRPILSALNDG